MAGAKVVAAAGIPITGVVPCAGSYDLSGVMIDQMLSGAAVKVPWYIPFVAFGYHSFYDDQINIDRIGECARRGPDG